MILELVTVVVAGLFLGSSVAELVPCDERRACLALAVAAMFGLHLGLDLVVVAGGGPAMAAGFLHGRYK